MVSPPQSSSRVAGPPIGTSPRSTSVQNGVSAGTGRHPPSAAPAVAAPHSSPCPWMSSSPSPALVALPLPNCHPCMLIGSPIATEPAPTLALPQLPTAVSAGHSSHLAESDYKRAYGSECLHQSVGINAYDSCRLCRASASTKQVHHNRVVMIRNKSSHTTGGCLSLCDATRTP